VDDAPTVTEVAIGATVNTLRTMRGSADRTSTSSERDANRSLDTVSV